ncbi:MAG: hypothetical protein VR74_18260 [Hyphomonas sp. BRH_c22]|nr:MAG: hypothetical protein VR74_18260 [Hyphomonas sp. BRH_c22]
MPQGSTICRPESSIWALADRQSAAAPAIQAGQSLEDTLYLHPHFAIGRFILDGLLAKPPGADQAENDQNAEND